MLGKDAAYDRLPYFFSDQYDVGMVLAGMNVGVWDVTDPIKALILAASEVDARALADPDVPLEQLEPR